MIFYSSINNIQRLSHWSTALSCWLWTNVTPLCGDTSCCFWFFVIIIVQHMSENILCIFESLCHFCIITFKCLIKRQSRPFTLFVDIGNKSVLWVQENLGVILEVHLHNFIAQSKHNSMFSSHPLLNINLDTALRFISHLYVSIFILFDIWIVVIF